MDTAQTTFEEDPEDLTIAHAWPEVTSPALTSPEVTGRTRVRACTTGSWGSRLFFHFYFHFISFFSFFFSFFLYQCYYFWYFFFIQHFQQVTTQNSVQWSSLPQDFLRAGDSFIVRFCYIFRELSIYNDVSWFHPLIFVFIQHLNHYFVDLLQFCHRCLR